MLYVALVLLLFNIVLLTLVVNYCIRWKSDRVRMTEYQTKYHNVVQELADIKAKLPNRDNKGRFVKNH